jgi:hypothetical protein
MTTWVVTQEYTRRARPPSQSIDPRPLGPHGPPPCPIFVLPSTSSRQEEATTDHSPSSRQEETTTDHSPSSNSGSVSGVLQPRIEGACAPADPRDTDEQAEAVHIRTTNPCHD